MVNPTSFQMLTGDLMVQFILVGTSFLTPGGKVGPPAVASSCDDNQLWSRSKPGPWFDLLHVPRLMSLQPRCLYRPEGGGPGALRSGSAKLRFRTATTAATATKTSTIIKSPCAWWCPFYWVVALLVGCSRAHLQTM